MNEYSMISDINRSVVTNTNDIEDISYTAWPTNHFERLYYVSSYFYQRPSAIHYVLYCRCTLPFIILSHRSPGCVFITIDRRLSLLLLSHNKRRLAAAGVRPTGHDIKNFFGQKILLDLSIMLH